MTFGDMNNSELDDDISYNRTLEYIASLRVDNTAVGNEFVDAIKQGYDSKINLFGWIMETFRQFISCFKSGNRLIFRNLFVE